MNSERYTYENLAAIDKNLLCKICSKPLLEPVSINNSDRLCRACVDPNSTSKDSITVITDVILISILNSLLVRCNWCQQSNIKRENIIDHEERHCSKRSVSCSAADLKCSWQGSFDKSNQHRTQCIFEQLRPALEVAMRRSEETVQYEKLYAEQRQKIEEISESIKQLQGQTDNLTSVFKFLSRNQANTEKRLEKLETEIRNNNDDRFKELQLEVQEIRTVIGSLRNDFCTLMEMNRNRDTSPKQTTAKTDQENLREEIRRLLEMDAKIESNFSSIRTKPGEENVEPELPDRQQTDRTDPPTGNSKRLENFLKKTASGYSFNAHDILLSDDDISYIIEHIFGKYECKKILFRKNGLSKNSINMIAHDLLSNKRGFQEVLITENGVTDDEVWKFVHALSYFNSPVECLDLQSNKITDVGAQHLANMLQGRTNLRLLFLTGNQIGDAGLHSLTQSLSTHNNMLEYLHLSSNERITDASVDSLIEMFDNNDSLKMVSVDGCGLTNQGKDKLRSYAETKLNSSFRFLEF